MTVTAPTRTTWRTVLADAMGPTRFVLDLDGADGEWRRMLEQNGHYLLDPADGLGTPVRGAVIARHLVSRARVPQRVLSDWLAMLEPGGRLVLLESPRRGLLRRASLLFPPRRPPDPRAPYRRGISPAEASLLLHAAGCVDIRCFALPVPPSAGVHYLASARRR